MKAKDLAERLLLDPEKEIMILDGFNGGGTPRIINFGPIQEVITLSDALTADDCEGREGEQILIIGFGCY